ncbi:MAG: GNAT family N-acetyltransferase [Myxococcales bacterium]|nr:GNAT family N-acetyltransferase [Myxococcales bacterium]
MSVRLALCDSASIAEHAPSLLALERTISYPLGDGRERFVIDHGEDYHRFFSSMGDAKFLLALEGSTVVGVLVGVLKQARFEGRSIETAYLCDYKLAESHRGAGLGARMLRDALILCAKHRELRRWRFAYGAAMRGARGDVLRSAKSALHPARLASGFAVLRLYFVEPDALFAIEPDSCPSHNESALELSPTAGGDELGLVSTEGRKDLRLVSTGARWPLVHATAPPSAWGPSLGHYLRSCGAGLVARGDRSLVCFALDERMVAHRKWLADRAIHSDTACTVYGLSLPGGPRKGAVVHLATSEI